MGHFESECPNKKEDQEKISIRQKNLSQRRCFACKEKGHKIDACPKQETKRQICQNRTVQFDKPKVVIYVEK
jgi:hypothetical protein